MEIGPDKPSREVALSPEADLDFIDLHLTVLDNPEAFPSTPEEAEVFRRELINLAKMQRVEIMVDTFEQAKELIAGLGNLGSGTLMGRRNKLRRVERNWQKTIDQRELYEQQLISDLLERFDTAEESQPIIEDFLYEGYERLLVRLGWVKAITIRNMAFFMERVEYEHRLANRAISSDRLMADPRKDRRINIIYGKTSERDLDAAVVLLQEVDALRQRGMDDTVVFRLLARMFHPDISEHPKQEELSRLLNMSYDSKAKKFKF